MPYNQDQLDQIRQCISDLIGEDWSPEYFAPFANKETVVGTSLLEIRDEAESFLGAADRHGDGWAGHASDSKKYQSTKKSAARARKALCQFVSDHEALDISQRFGVWFSSFMHSEYIEKQDPPEEQTIQAAVDAFHAWPTDAVKVCIEKLEEVEARYLLASKLGKRGRGAPPDYERLAFVVCLVDKIEWLTGAPIKFSKRNEPCGPAIDFLLSCLQPLRPEITANAAGKMIERLRKNSLKP